MTKENYDIIVDVILALQEVCHILNDMDSAADTSHLEQIVLEMQGQLKKVIVSK